MTTAEKATKVIVKKESTSGLFLLFLVFLALKLTGYITWSWWWVTAPLWGPLALLASIMAAVGLFMGLAVLCIAIAEWWNRA